MDQETRQEQQEIKYATPMMRLWAWVGVVYVVAILLLTTYGMAHGGRFLGGLGPLMVTPALLGLGGSAVLRYREGKGRGGPAACGLISGACLLLSIFNLVRGIPVLVAQLVG